MKASKLAAMAGLAAVLALAGSIQAEVTFTKVYRITGSYGTLSDAVIDDGVVAFDKNLQSVYRWSDGNLRIVADSTTIMPGTGIHFDQPCHPVVDSGNVYFYGIGGSSPQVRGAYKDSGGVLSAVVTNTMTSPSGLSYCQPQIHAVCNGEVLFADSDLLGTYRTVYRLGTGGTTAIVDSATLLPGGRTCWPAEDRIDGTTIVFGAHLSSGNSALFGVYLSSGGTISRVVDSSMVDPKKGSAFTRFGSCDISSGTVMFTGFYSGGSGVYMADGGTIRAVAQAGDLRPDGRGAFQGIANPIAADEGNILFEDNIGIYAYYHGQLVNVISRGDILDGKTVQQADISFGHCLSGGEAVFTATFTDNTIGVYVASLPEPATISFLAVGALAMLRRRRIA